MYAATCRGKAAMAATTAIADTAMRKPRRMSILSKEARYWGPQTHTSLSEDIGEITIQDRLTGVKHF